MDNLIAFDRAFPDSRYRKVFPQYTGRDRVSYQKSKAPINSTIYAFEDVKDTDGRIGWIVPLEYVVIDVDDRKYAEVIYNILVDNDVRFSFMVSRKGGHFIFKNPENIKLGVRKFTALGIPVDIRSMESGYIILPHNDSDRQWGVITNSVDLIPKYLTPQTRLKNCKDMVGMRDGEGRNTALYEHIMALKDYSSGLTTDDILMCARLINTYLFVPPMPEEELQSTVLRTEIVQKIDEDLGDKTKPEKVKKEVFLEELATEIIKDTPMITVAEDTYVYDGKYYKKVSSMYLQRLIHDKYVKPMFERDRNELIAFIKLKTYVPIEEVDSRWDEIVVKNGILNITKMTLREHTPSEYHTVYIDIAFNPTVDYSGPIDGFLNQITSTDLDRKILFLEIIGYCFLKRPAFEKFIILYGRGGTGKSTYLDLIKKLVGKRYCSFLSLQNLGQEYYPAELFGKLVNIGDDVSFKSLKDATYLKKVVTGEEILVRPIFKSPFSFENFATLLFASNIMPAFDEKTDGLHRRMMLIDMNVKIEKPDHFFLEKLTEQDIEYVFYKAICAVSIALRRGKFIELDSVDKNLERFKLEQSTANAFCADKGYTKLSLHMVSTKQLYDEYKTYCSDEIEQIPLILKNFVTDVCNTYGLSVVRTTHDGGSNCNRFSAMD